MHLRWITSLLLCCGCTRAVPTLDQPQWLAQLTAKRPELARQHQGSVRDPAWQALVIRPEYRAEILSDPSSTYEEIVAREYAADEQAADRAWAQALRDGQAAMSPTPTLKPAGYPAAVYTGYRVGGDWRFEPAGAVHDFKVFLELANVVTSLTPARYLGFSQALDAAGFRGDSKVDLRPGHVRFQYNNVIVHAISMDDARCAEAVALRFFRGELRHVARGVDGEIGGQVLDWHHYLLEGGFAHLNPEVRAFILYDDGIQAPIACR